MCFRIEAQELERLIYDYSVKVYVNEAFIWIEVSIDIPIIGDDYVCHLLFTKKQPTRCSSSTFIIRPLNSVLFILHGSSAYSITIPPHISSAYIQCVKVDKVFHISTVHLDNLLCILSLQVRVISSCPLLSLHLNCLHCMHSVIISFAT